MDSHDDFLEFAQALFDELAGWDSYIQASDVPKILRRLQITTTPDQADDLLLAIDPTRSGYVHRSAFLNW